MKRVVAFVVFVIACAPRPYDERRNDYLLQPIPRGYAEFGLGTRQFDPEALRDAIAHDSRAEIRAVAVMRLGEQLGERAIPEIRAVLDHDPSPIVVERAAFELRVLCPQQPATVRDCMLR